MFHTTPSKNFKFIDLFSGIGGFHLAMSGVGGECVFASEIDKYAQQTYQENFGIMPYGDITKIDEKDVPEHDVLCGGFPCQAFSIAGKRRGFEDTRGTMFFHIARIVKEKQPKVIFLENVKGLLSHDSGRTFKTITETLDELGYNVFYDVINAAELGFAQSRVRVYIVAFRKDLGIKEFAHIPEVYTARHQFVSDILQSEEQINQHFLSVSLRDAKNVQEGDKEASIGDEELDAIKRSQLKITPSSKLTFVDGNNCNNHNGDESNQNTPNSRKRKRDVSHPQKIAIIQEGRQGERIYSINAKAITLSTSSGGVFSNTGGYLVGDIARKLTVRECARLQGFPEDFKIVCSDKQAYRQFGNAVCVDVVGIIAKQIIETLSTTD